jgi:carboxymethylenebutenolidase
MGSNVSFNSQGVQLQGYLAQPQGEGNHPALVVIHEIYGLNQNIREVADRFAAEGYVAFAVDLFSRGNRLLCVMRVMRDLLSKLDSNKGVIDLKNALTFLAEQPGVDTDRLGAIGFCMGGSYAVAWSCVDERLKVIAPYYGFNPKPLESVARACAVVGSYPTKDPTTGAGKKLKEALDRYNVPNDIKIYEARHSFFNDKSRAYNPAAAEDSWKRVTAFFKSHLKINQT